VEGGFMALARPVAEPPGSARPVFEVEYELAERMGLHQEYPFHDTVSWIEFMIKPSGVTFELLDMEQIVYATPPIQYRKYIDKGFLTPSGKVDLFCPSFEAHGYGPIPSYTDPAGEPLGAKDVSAKGLSLLGTSRRPAQFVHTKFKNLKTLSKVYPEPFVWIHPQDASDRDIREGDEVEVRSPQGKIIIKAKLTEETKSGLVWIDFGWGNPTDGKANINVLPNDAYFDPVSGGTPNRMFPCEVEKK
jgi:anaerobic selenocysteine-containing dehydrogenase